MQILKGLNLTENCDGALITDSALLKTELLELVAKRGSGCYHFGSVILDKGVAHIDCDFVVLHAFSQVGLDFCNEFRVELLTFE